MALLRVDQLVAAAVVQHLMALLLLAAAVVDAEAVSMVSLEDLAVGEAATELRILLDQETLRLLLLLAATGLLLLLIKVLAAA